MRCDRESLISLLNAAFFAGSPLSFPSISHDLVPIDVDPHHSARQILEVRTKAGMACVKLQVCMECKLLCWSTWFTPILRRSRCCQCRTLLLAAAAAPAAVARASSSEQFIIIIMYAVTIITSSVFRNRR